MRYPNNNMRRRSKTKMEKFKEFAKQIFGDGEGKSRADEELSHGQSNRSKSKTSTLKKIMIAIASVTFVYVGVQAKNYLWQTQSNGGRTALAARENKSGVTPFTKLMNTLKGRRSGRRSDVAAPPAREAAAVEELGKLLSSRAEDEMHYVEVTTTHDTKGKRVQQKVNLYDQRRSPVESEQGSQSYVFNEKVPMRDVNAMIWGGQAWKEVDRPPPKSETEVVILYWRGSEADDKSVSEVSVSVQSELQQAVVGESVTNEFNYGLTASGRSVMEAMKRKLEQMKPSSVVQVYPVYEKFEDGTAKYLQTVVFVEIGCLYFFHSPGDVKDETNCQAMLRELFPNYSGVRESYVKKEVSILGKKVSILGKGGNPSQYFTWWEKISK